MLCKHKGGISPLATSLRKFFLYFLSIPASAGFVNFLLMILPENRQAIYRFDGKFAQLFTNLNINKLAAISSAQVKSSGLERNSLFFVITAAFCPRKAPTPPGADTQQKQPPPPPVSGTVQTFPHHPAFRSGSRI